MGQPEKLNSTYSSFSFKTKNKTKTKTKTYFGRGKETRAKLVDDELFVNRLAKSLDADNSIAFFYKCLKYITKGQLLEIEGRALKTDNPLFYFIGACKKEFIKRGV